MRIQKTKAPIRLSVIVALLLAVAFPGAAVSDSPWLPAGPAPFRVAISVSPFTELLFSTGIVYSDGKATAKTVEELQKMFVAHGANEVYARIATSRAKTPGFGDHSLDRGLMRARLAKSLGLPFNPELGLFKVYGDVRCQPAPDFSEYPELKIPAAWTALAIDQMLPILRSYGAIVAKMILETGVRVGTWDLGNEVDFGVAGVSPQPMPGGCDDLGSGSKWYQPPDRVDREIGENVGSGPPSETTGSGAGGMAANSRVKPYEAQIFAAVAEGVRSVDPAARFSTHVERSARTSSDRS